MCRHAVSAAPRSRLREGDRQGASLGQARHVARGPGVRDADIPGLGREVDLAVDVPVWFVSGDGVRCARSRCPHHGHGDGGRGAGRGRGWIARPGPVKCGIVVARSTCPEDGHQGLAAARLVSRRSAADRGALRKAGETLARPTRSTGRASTRSRARCARRGERRYAREAAHTTGRAATRSCRGPAGSFGLTLVGPCRRVAAALFVDCPDLGHLAGDRTRPGQARGAISQDHCVPMWPRDC